MSVLRSMDSRGRPIGGGDLEKKSADFGKI